MKFGEKSQEFSNSLYTGFSMVEVVAINPSTSQRGEIYGYTPKEDAKEQIYEGKDTSGDEFVDIVAYLRFLNHPDKPIMTYRVRLIDKDVVSEKEENGEKKVSYQYVNNCGGQSWIDDPKNLLDKFTHAQVKGQNVGERQYRKAIIGEGNFYGFMQSWLDKGVSFFGESSIETDIFLDKKKAFRNIEKYVDSELRPLIEAEQTGKFNALAMVGISEKDGKVSHFQNVYNNFWPDWKFKSMLPAINSGNWNATPELIKSHDYLVKSLKKSAYTLGWIRNFDENFHMNAGNEIFKAEGGDEPVVDALY